MVIFTLKFIFVYKTIQIFIDREKITEKIYTVVKRILSTEIHRN